MSKKLVFIICLILIQTSSGQESSKVFDIIEKVAEGELPEMVTIADQRGGKHTVFVKDGNIFYFTPKSDTVNLSYSEAKSSNPFVYCIDDTLYLFWREETEHTIDVFYRRRFILTPIGQWARPICIFSKMKEK